jgi:hypothetical protein
MSNRKLKRLAMSQRFQRGRQVVLGRHFGAVHEQGKDANTGTAQAFGDLLMILCEPRLHDRCRASSRLLTDSYRP